MYRFDDVSRIGRSGLVAIAAAMTVTLVACSDDTTAPHTPAAPQFAAQGKAGAKKPQTVSAQVVDIGWNPITELPTVRFMTDNDTIDVQDNSIKDKDPKLGFFKVQLSQSSQYSACVIGETQSYMAVAGYNWAPVCGTATPNGQDPLPVLYGYMRKKPRVLWDMRDWQANLLLGGTVEIQFNGSTFTVSDGDMTWDESGGLNGHIYITLRAEGTLSYCEIVPPPGYLIADNACGTLPIYWDGQNSGGFYHSPAPTSAPR